MTHESFRFVLFSCAEYFDILYFTQHHKLQLEQQLALRLAALNIGMSPSSVLERVYLVHDNIKLAAAHKFKELCCVLFQILANGDIAVENGAHKANILGAELQDAYWRNSSRLE